MVPCIQSLQGLGMIEVSTHYCINCDFSIIL
uniref:Uncharacterized protein n=1 Tax=viral metagenome TaxID=1070528 RepID=A0A6C0BNI1_9ZZZZ